MYSPSTYTALDTNVDRRLRRRVYLFSRRSSSSFCWMRSMRLGPPMMDVGQRVAEVFVVCGLALMEVLTAEDGKERGVGGTEAQ